MAAGKGYKDLEVHRISLGFPEPARRELGRQLREATKSIAANIAEGYGRRSSAAEFKRFLTMAIGSCDEVKVWLDFATDLGYLPNGVHRELLARYEELGKMLSGLAKNWRQF